MLARVSELQHETAVFYEALEGPKLQVQSKTVQVISAKTKGWMVMGEVEAYLEVSLWVSVLGAHLLKKNPTE
jgi:hypothetical protein